MWVRKGQTGTLLHVQVNCWLRFSGMKKMKMLIWGGYHPRQKRESAFPWPVSPLDTLKLRDDWHFTLPLASKHLSVPSNTAAREMTSMVLASVGFRVWVWICTLALPVSILGAPVRCPNPLEPRFLIHVQYDYQYRPPTVLWAIK